MTLLSPSQNRALALLERARPRDAIDPALREDAGWLIDQGFVIDYEDKLLSIVVRQRSTADLEIGRGDRVPAFVVHPQTV